MTEVVAKQTQALIVKALEAIKTEAFFVHIAHVAHVA
jgi:hypothetical protein